VCRSQFFLCPNVRAPHGLPAYSCANESIDEPEFEKVTKAEREFVFYWFDFTLPNGSRMTNRRAAAKIIAFQPPANFSDRNSGKPRGIGYSIKSSI
jgi:hypothetical protein